MQITQWHSQDDRVAWAHALKQLIFELSGMARGIFCISNHYHWLYSLCSRSTALEQ